MIVIDKDKRTITVDGERVLPYASAEAFELLSDGSLFGTSLPASLINSGL